MRNKFPVSGPASARGRCDPPGRRRLQAQNRGIDPDWPDRMQSPKRKDAP